MYWIHDVLKFYSTITWYKVSNQECSNLNFVARLCYFLSNDVEFEQNVM
jgi:hypothetical protein